jgi:hypothetical protein
MSHLLILHVVVSISSESPGAESLGEQESIGVVREDETGDDLNQSPES